MTSCLPQDILEEILIRMPTKTLLCFRCVSRSCRSLIDSSSFINRHINYSNQTATNHHFILREPSLNIIHSPTPYMPKFGELPSDFYSVSLDHEGFCTSPKCLTNPITYNGWRTLVLGTCNGLLLLRDYAFQHLVLWNPFTRKHKKIPNDAPSIIDPNYRPQKFKYIGFGYDDVNDDYKVLKLIGQFKDMNTPMKYEAHVYSLRTNIWTRTRDFLPTEFVALHAYGVFANGALYWLAFYPPYASKNISDRANLLAFNCGKEDFQVLPLPPHHTKGSCKNLINVQGYLCLTCTDDLTAVTIYLMNHNGTGKNSWTKLWIVGPKYIPGRFIPLMPLISSSGSAKMFILDMSANCVILYNWQEKGSSTIVEMFSNKTTLVVCLESLVMLGDDDDLDGAQSTCKTGWQGY